MKALDKASILTAAVVVFDILFPFKYICLLLANDFTYRYK